MMKAIFISVFVTMFFTLLLFIMLIGPNYQHNTFTLYVSQEFLNNFEKHKLQSINSIVGTDREGNEIVVALDSPNESTISKEVGLIDNIKAHTYHTYVLLSHSTTCNKRSDLEPHEPVASCIAGGWYYGIKNGQPYHHCHCYVPWGQP